MTALDLTAVCERHGIDLRELDVLGAGDTVTLAVCRTTPETRMGTTPADAVCALLKARYRIGTVVKDEGQSDFAAAVALADRLRGDA